MTGLALCRELVARDSACTFVVISGNADVASAVEAMKLGAVDLLEKPFSHTRLTETAKKAIDLAVDKAKQQSERGHVTVRLASLSPREREVPDAVAAGLVSKEI